MTERKASANLKIPPQIIDWLKSAFQEDMHGAVKKADLYSEYEAFCKQCRIKPKDPNTFGKYVLRVFPSAYPSRLGSILDGSQAHCYSGISKRAASPAPSPSSSPRMMQENQPLKKMEIEEVVVPKSYLLDSSQQLPVQPQPLPMPQERCSFDMMSDSPIDSELEALVDAMLSEADGYGDLRNVYNPGLHFLLPPLPEQPQQQQQYFPQQPSQPLSMYDYLAASLPPSYSGMMVAPSAPQSNTSPSPFMYGGSFLADLASAVPPSSFAPLPSTFGDASYDFLLPPPSPLFSTPCVGGFDDVSTSCLSYNDNIENCLR